MSSPDPISRDEASALDALHACFTALAEGRLDDAAAFPAEVLAEARALLLRHEAIEDRASSEPPTAWESAGPPEPAVDAGDAGDACDATRWGASGAIAAGTRIGAFTIQEFLGHGATGEVYRAIQHAPSREVALKVLLPEFAGGSDLHREAETLANLEHPSIARLYQTGEARMGPLRRRWIAMQYVPGRRTLADWAAERARASGPDARACVPMMIAIADAVAFAHGRGVIHRDLKPGNILVDPEARPVLIDFGVARLLSVDTQQTLHALGPRVVGTLAYAAPESLDARTPPDVRVDVFALGAILYELLAHEPFRTFRAHDLGGMLAEALSGASNHRVGAMSRPGLRGDLDRIVAKATATDPAARYASVSQFADDLRRHLAGEPVLAELQTPVERWMRAIRRHRRTVAAATAAVGLLLATTAVSLAFARDARAKARLAHLSAAARALQDADLMLVSQHAQALGAHDGTLERDVLERAGALRGTTVAEGDWYSIACDARADRIYAFGYPVPYVSRPVVAGFRRAESPGDRASWTMEWSHPSLDTATNCIALSPDGTRLAAFDAGGALVVLDARDGRVLGGNGAPEAVPNGLSVAIASDGTIAAARDVLDLRPIDEPGRLIARVDPAIGTIRAIAFNPIDPTTLVAVGHAGAVLLARDGARVDVVTRFEVPDSFQSAAVWTPDGRHLAMSGRDRTVRLYSPTAAKPLWTAHGHRDSVWTLAIDARAGVDDAARVLSAGADGTLRAWRLSDGAPMAATPLSDDIVWSIARTEEGTLVAGTQGALAISDGARIEAWMGRGPAEPFARTGRALRIEPGARARLVEVDGGRERPLPEIPGAGAVSRVAISPDDARVLLLREDGTISLVDVAAATVRWSTTALRREDVHEPNGIPSLALDAVDARAIVASRPLGCTALSARDGAILWNVPVGASCTDVAVSHDGTRVFAADRDGLVESLDARDGTPIASSRRQRTRTSCMAVSADGSRLVTGGTDGTLRILDARTLEEQLNILLSPEQLRSVWIADDGIHAVDRAGIERVR
jgi:WD40 repeat protein